MKISLLALILFVLAMPGAAVHGMAQEAAQDSPSAVAAKQIIQELVAGQFEKVEALYDARMAAALPPGKLADGWRDLNKQAGAFQAITSTETSQVQGLQVVKMQCKFENSLLDATMVFNPDGKLGGLSFQPHQAPPPPWNAPAYAKQNLFSEQPLMLVNGKYELPGTLTVPNGDGPFPGVVLVQGSGPEDQDETLGPNKPLKDLAWGGLRAGTNFGEPAPLFPRAEKDVIERMQNLESGNNLSAVDAAGSPEKDSAEASSSPIISEATAPCSEMTRQNAPASGVPTGLPS